VEARGDGCFATCLLDDRKQCLQYPSRTNIAKNDYQSFFYMLVALLGFNSPFKAKSKREYLTVHSFAFLWWRRGETVALQPACSTTANNVCSTRLAPTSLKTIINRFLYARCPLRVQLPFNQKKRSIPQWYTSLFSGGTGVVNDEHPSMPVFSPSKASSISSSGIWSMLNGFLLALMIIVK